MIKRKVPGKPAMRDPWMEIKGILAPEEADKMIRVINKCRRNKNRAPRIGEP